MLDVIFLLSHGAFEATVEFHDVEHVARAVLNMLPALLSRKLLVRELRSLAHRVSLGVIGGGGSGLAVFSAIPQLELDKTPLPKGPVLGQISVLLGKWLFGRPEERQASSDAADAGLGVSSDAADAGLGVSSDAAAAAGLGVSASHVAT